MHTDTAARLDAWLQASGALLVERALLRRLLEDLAALDRYAAGTAGVRR